MRYIIMLLVALFTTWCIYFFSIPIGNKHTEISNYTVQVHSYLTKEETVRQSTKCATTGGLVDVVNDEEGTVAVYCMYPINVKQIETQYYRINAKNLN